LSFHLFPPTDTAPFVGAPLAGEAVRAGMFSLSRFAIRFIDHSLVIWQNFERHFSSLLLIKTIITNQKRPRPAINGVQNKNAYIIQYKKSLMNLKT
jgi:hypothetical protein